MRVTMECADCGRRGPTLGIERRGERCGTQIGLRDFDEDAKAWLVRTDVERSKPTSTYAGYTELRLESVCPRCQRERAADAAKAAAGVP